MSAKGRPERGYRSAQHEGPPVTSAHPHPSTTAASARVTLPSAQPVLRVVPMPADVNQHGDIFGGWIMSQVDIAGGVLAARQARGRVATVAVNSFTFKEPVLVGDVVSFYGEVLRVGRTSVTVSIEVYAQRNPDDLVTVKVTEASLTYVAVGADRRPRPIVA
jgi:acyl-CoA thioesterase YciA